MNEKPHLWSDVVSFELGMMVIFARAGELYRVYPKLYRIHLSLITLSLLARMIPIEE